MESTRGPMAKSMKGIGKKVSRMDMELLQVQKEKRGAEYGLMAIG